jgi:phage terminase small subunit
MNRGKMPGEQPGFFIGGEIMADNLTVKQEKYVQGLFAGLSQREAYKQAFKADKMKDKTIDEKACILAKRDKIAARLKGLQDEVKERSIIKAKDVLQHWYDIATADPNEIIHLRRICCRHCYGIDHEYQWRDEKEYQQAVRMAKQQAKESEKPPAIPADAGGYGYDRLLRPHPKCPYCWGEGHMEVHAADTRTLSPKAKLLYAGVKQTRDGFEIKMRDQDKAMENVAKHLGMFVDRTEITGKDGGPIQTQSLTDQELDAKIKRLIGQVVPDDDS